VDRGSWIELSSEPPSTRTMDSDEAKAQVSSVIDEAAAPAASNDQQPPTATLDHQPQADDQQQQHQQHQHQLPVALDSLPPPVPDVKPKDASDVSTPTDAKAEDKEVTEAAEPLREFCATFDALEQALQTGT